MNFLQAWRKELLAIIGGGLWAAAFPRLEWASGAWVCHGIILLAAQGSSPKQAFRIGYLAGLVNYLISLHWLLFIPFLSGAVAGWAALSAYLSLYPAVWLWGIRQLARHVDLLEMPPRARMGWLCLAAILWVALEMILTRFLSGFPWNILGVSQYHMLPLIQIASLTGPYGVSFLLIWFSTSLMAGGLMLFQNPARRWSALGPIAPPFLAVTLVMMFGMRQIWNRASEAGRSLRIALVQPSIPQTLIWDEKENTNRFNRLVDLSRTALAAKPDLLVWPEAALPTMLRYNEETAKAVIGLAKEHHVWVVLGSDDAIPKGATGTNAPQEYRFYNSGFLINPDGELAGVYRKRRLVIFGEYVPFVETLPWLKHLTPVGENGFTAGDKPVDFHLPDLKTTFGVLICFEDVFPHLVREYVHEDSDFLLNLTNNGWFGESAAQWQHAANAVFRAVENSIPLVRCANNGLTCWVDEIGRLHETYFGDSTDVYGAGFKIATVPIQAPGARRDLTLYTRHGDVFGWSCVGIVLLAGLGHWRQSRSRATPKESASLPPVAP